jgi:hypothetical protein
MGGSSRMTFYQILTLIGVEGVFSAVIIWVWKQVTGVRKGVQALLRTQMIDMYNTWYPKGYAPIHVKQNFENCWKNYHSLGVNGVMDDLHIKFLELPTEERGVEDED